MLDTLGPFQGKGRTWCLMQKGRVSADKSQGRIQVDGHVWPPKVPTRRTCWLCRLRHCPSSLLAAGGCSVSPRLQGLAAAGKDAEWFFWQNSALLSESCTDRMNSDYPLASRPLHGQLPPQIRHRLKGATRTPKPQQPVLPNAKPTASLEGKWLRGHSRARCGGRAHSSQGDGQDTWTF